MSITSIQNSTATFAAQTTRSATKAADPAPIPVDGPPKRHQGDGSVLAALKQSLADAGVTGTDASESKATRLAEMHSFVHSVFAAIHDQRQAGASANPGQVPTLSEALNTLASNANQGNAPADMQAAFEALQKHDAPGSPGATATLGSVLSAMSATVSAGAGNSLTGGAIDIQA